MIIDDLLEKQRQLDALIAGKLAKPLEENERLTDTILALMVEAGEMANEVRCFKFWSKKPRSEKAVILEEFVDMLHFYLSIANQLGFSEEDIVSAYNRKYEININRQNSGY